MGWGFLMGLGQGLNSLANTTQNWYEQDRLAKQQALQNALAERAASRADEALKLEGQRTALEGRRTDAEIKRNEALTHQAENEQALRIWSQMAGLAAPADTSIFGPYASAAIDPTTHHVRTPIEQQAQLDSLQGHTKAALMSAGAAQAQAAAERERVALERQRIIAAQNDVRNDRDFQMEMSILNDHPPSGASSPQQMQQYYAQRVAMIKALRPDLGARLEAALPAATGAADPFSDLSRVLDAYNKSRVAK